MSWARAEPVQTVSSRVAHTRVLLQTHCSAIMGLGSPRPCDQAREGTTPVWVVALHAA